jgi:Zn-dependent metalloprotease
VTDRSPLACIVPPHLLRRLLENGDELVRSAALSTLLTTTRLRGERGVRSALSAAAPPAQGRRTIHDCRHGTDLAAAVVARTEDGPVSADPSVNAAFDGFGATREYYRSVHDRNSVDDRGMRLEGYVHRGVAYQNAFWDGREMVFGDGDGEVFTDFTGSLDVIAHELTHGVTEYTSGFVYAGQPGALNESVSDVFGSVVRQWSLGQTVQEADWLIGADIFTPAIDADGLRSMRAPGTAYDNALLGTDPQPAHMAGYVELPDTEEGDNGGVHINSGIPNKAFHLAATGIGGRSWEGPAQIWYAALRASGPSTDFAGFAQATWTAAGELYGAGSDQQQAVAAAWAGVGVPPAGART